MNKAAQKAFLVTVAGVVAGAIAIGFIKRNNVPVLAPLL